MLIKTVIILIVVCVLTYLLYLNGYITIQNKKALMFVGKNGFIDRHCYAKFSACTGRLKKVIRFKEKRQYAFTLDCKLEKGEVKVTLYGADKKPVFVLTPENPSAVIDADLGRYYMEIEIYKAYGSYDISWK